MLPRTKEKYSLFARRYVNNGLNGAKAARDTGFAENTARQTARRLLTNEYVKEEVLRFQANLVGKMEISTDEVVRELRKLAGLDGEVEKLNNTDRIRSLELLGRHLAMFTDRYENGDKDKAPVLTPAEVERYKLLAKHFSKGA